MSFQVNLAPSVVSKLAKNDTTGEEEGMEGSGKRREDWRKLKELEEARKAGTAPAMQDEEGRDINPHIPQYIMQAPWYYDVTQATLKHQRIQEEALKTYSGLGAWYKKGVKKGPIASKYRKGACENCGALTHVKKDCLERPRKVGAKFTGEEIAPDEHLQPQLDFDFDGKRDRWNGYDPSMHKQIYEDFQMLEEAKRQLKAKKLDNPNLEEDQREKIERDEDLDDEDDEDKYADDMDMPGQKFESKQRITVRNLRIREDTAKYLYNLDVSSAFYDPKTRSMRENPFNGKHPTEIPFAGDNFVRFSGDAHQMTKQQMFSWEAYEKGTEAHLQADPTKLEILANEYSRKKEDYKTNVKDSILDKYGGQEHLEAPPKELLLAQTEDYVEYSRHGTVIKGAEKAKVKSRYEEDVYINNHTNVWGSWWKEGQWGFVCCHSTIKMSYCTGSAGQSAEASSIIPVTQAEPPRTQEEEKSPDTEEEEEEKVSRKKKKKKEKKKKRKRKHKKKKKEVSSSSDDSDSTDEDEAKERKIKEAMKKEEERRKEVDRIMKMDERKRPYNVSYEFKAPTEEELEAYKRTKYNPEDPMSSFTAY